jgi:hypothetical protein
MTTDTLRQVFGTLRTPNGSPFPNKSLKWFRERRTTVAQGSSVVLDDPFIVATDAQGDIDTAVMAGSYLVMTPLSDADRYFRVVVPDQVGPFDISSLIDGPTSEPDDLTQFEALVAKAKAWANAPEDTVVESGEFSAKHYAAKALEERLGAQSAVDTAVANSLAKAEEWAENLEDVEVEAGRYSAKHWASKSSADADVAAALADAAEVSAGAAAAHAAGAIYPNEATGRAAVANGQYFFVEGATADQFYHLHRRIDASTVTTALRTYPTLAYLQANFRQPLDEDKVDLGALATEGPSGNFFDADVIQTDHATYTMAAGAGDCWFYLRPKLDQVGATVVDVIIQVESGVLDNMTLEQRDASNAVLTTETAPVNEWNGIWATRSITLNGSFNAFRLRMRNTTSGVDTVLRMPQLNTSGRLLYGNEESANAAAARMLALTDKAAARNIYNINKVQQIVGTGSVMAGRTITVPAGNIVEGRVDLTGVADASDELTLIYKASAPLRGVSVSPHTGLPGGSSTNVGGSVYLGGGFYMKRISAAAAGGADPAYASIRVDNRDQAPITAINPVTLTHLWLGVNVSGVPAFITAPASVNDLLGEAGVATAYVDPETGDDSNSGSSGSPLATVAAAVGGGAARVFCRKSDTPHRLASGISTVGVQFIGYAEDGDTETHARIWSAENRPAADWSATAADANVYFLATATNPSGMWEVASDGAITRMGVDDVVPGRMDPAADEADVRANAGAWWHGTGSEGAGIYIHPYGSSITGKSYEVPTADVSISITGGVAAFDGVEVCFGRSNVVGADRCTVASKGSRFGRSGNSDGVYFGNNVHWTDFGTCEYFDAGDDGVNTNGGNVTFISLGGSRAYHCRGDGVAPHGNGQTIILTDMDLVDNYKQGFVTIGTGTFKLKGCTFKGNADVDMLVRLGAASVASVVELDRCTADSAEISVDTPSLTTGFVHNHNGPLRIKADVSVKSHRSVGWGGVSLLVEGGTVSLDDFSYKGSSTGIDLRAGSLTVTNGAILRGTNGIVRTGGTITLDANSPVNVPESGTVGAPTTRTSGLTAGEVAALASVAAV